MPEEKYWNCFMSTGDPVFYLLSRKERQVKKQDQRPTDRTGETPRPRD